MAGAPRPLSPHLQIYRPQLTSVLSILHRLTGLALGLGAVLLAWWLHALAAGPEAYAGLLGLLGSWLGLVVLFGLTFAGFYHLCNGVRHLLWDLGYGLELASVYRSGWAVVAGSAALTVIAFAWGLALAGGGS
jgi:succinate dehydrogenase / fumarate reductase cytochrome b subunit